MQFFPVAKEPCDSISGAILSRRLPTLRESLQVLRRTVTQSTDRAAKLTARFASRRGCFQQRKLPGQHVIPVNSQGIQSLGANPHLSRLERVEACACGDEMAQDHVLLEAHKVIHLACQRLLR